MLETVSQRSIPPPTHPSPRGPFFCCTGLDQLYAINYRIYDSFRKKHFSLLCFQVCKTLQFKRFLFNQTQPLPVRVHNQILPRVYTIYTSTDRLIVLTTNWTRPAKQPDLKSTLKQYRQVFKEKPMWKVWQSTIRRLPFLIPLRLRWSDLFNLCCTPVWIGLETHHDTF